MGAPILPHEAWPIAVYDIELKQCVLVFESMNICGQYLLPHVSMKNRQNVVPYIRRYVHEKQRCNKNLFNRPLALRVANTEQKALLNGEIFHVLNPDFTIDKYRRHSQEKILEGNVAEPCAFKGILEASTGSVISSEHLYKKSKRRSKSDKPRKEKRLYRGIYTWKLSLDKSDPIIHGRQESEYTICGKIIKKEYSKPWGKMKNKEELTCEPCRKALNSNL